MGSFGVSVSSLPSALSCHSTNANFNEPSSRKLPFVQVAAFWPDRTAAGRDFTDLEVTVSNVRFHQLIFMVPSICKF